ncbi:rhomboid family intramembrane serine protease [Marinomonas sp.]
MFPIYRFKPDADPAVLSRFLWQQKIAHRIEFSNGHNELWLVNAQNQAYAVEIITAWESGEDLSQIVSSASAKPIRKASSKSLVGFYLTYPATITTIALAAIVAFVTQLGADLTSVAYFSISPFEVFGSQVRFLPLEEVLAQGDYWRLLSPAFLHFSLLHFIFNVLWVWDVGRKIEHLLGSFLWAVGVLVTALLSNVLQYEINGNPLFGGLSGVVYGLIGFAWLTPLLHPRWPRLISKQLMVFFVVWLGIGYTQIPEMVGLGSIANTAHTIGLVTGLILSGLYCLANTLWTKASR